MKRLWCASREVLVWTSVALGLGLKALPADGQAAPPASGGRARIEAVRSEQALRVDGQLDEPIWQRAQFIRDFVQREPREGEPATQRTEIAFVYTEDALYVGARMQESGGE